MNAATDLGLRGYLGVLRRHLWTMLGVFTVLVVTTLVVSALMTPVYEARTRLEVRSIAGTPGSALVGGGNDPERELLTQVELVKSQPVLGAAASSLGLRSARVLKDHVTATLVRETQLIEVIAQHQQPQTAAAWADAVAVAFVDYKQQRALEGLLAAREALQQRIEVVEREIVEIDSQQAALPANTRPSAQRETLVARLIALEGQLQSLPLPQVLQRQPSASLVAPADMPQIPIRPRPRLYLAGSIVLGAALAVVVAALAESLDDRYDDRLHTREQLEAVLGAPVLAVLPTSSGQREQRSPLLTLTDPQSDAAEGYRALRNAILLIAGEETPFHSLLVTSVDEGEVATIVSANLGVALALTGLKTAIVAADLHEPRRLQGLFEKRPELGPELQLMGLAELLNGAERAERVVQRLLTPASGDESDFIRSGGRYPHPSDLLASDILPKVLAELRTMAECAVLAGPPLLARADAKILASVVSGVLLVASADRTRRETVERAERELRRVGARLIGGALLLGG